jgi:hypothetical protein
MKQHSPQWQGGSRRRRIRSHLTYIVEFRTAEGESLAICIPRREVAVLKHFQARMPQRR